MKNSNRFQIQYSVNDAFFDIIGEEQAWLLGLIACDGCVHNDRLFSLSQSFERGKVLLETVQRVLAHSGNLYHSKNAFALTITSKQIVQRLTDFGIVPRKTLIYTFPEALPIERHAAFVRGYIEGDGSTGVYETNTAKYPCISFVGTLEFISRCADIIPIAGQISQIKRARNLYDMRFNGQKAFHFAKWLWSNPTLPRTRKQQIIENFFSEHSPKYIQSAQKREQVLHLLNEGMRPEKIADEVGLAFQTVYRWRKMANGNT